MDIEHLTKTQIILLTLLTSFVTSIATGIVTVSLMDQAPPAIAQTVNRVVERTVEKVVPQAQSASAVQTIVIKESDLISQAIDEVRSSIVRLYSVDAESPTFLGLGLIMNGAGIIVTDGSALGEGTVAIVEQNNGLRVRASVDRRDDSGLAYLSTATSSIDGKAVTWKSPAQFSGKVSLGETVFTVSGKSASRVGDGIVTAIEPQEEGSIIDTDISSDSIMKGSPLVDTDGLIVGISSSVSRDVFSSGFLPAAAIVLEPKAAEKKPGS